MLIFDPNARCRFILIDRPVPVTDFVTKAPVADGDGKAIHRYTVLVIREEGRPTQITVKAPALGNMIEPGTPVTIQALTGVLWERDGKQSVSFRASALTPTAVGAKQ